MTVPHLIVVRPLMVTECLHGCVEAVYACGGCGQLNHVQFKTGGRCRWCKVLNRVEPT